MLNRVPENGWFVVENPIKMDDLGVPLFLEIPIKTSGRFSLRNHHHQDIVFANFSIRWAATSYK